VDIHAAKVFEETLKDNIELKQTQAQLQEYQKVQKQHIEELARSNEELQQFAFVASHDLQEPVRKVLYYSDFVINQYAEELPKKGAHYLKTIQQSAERMRILIKDLLLFSQIKKEAVELTQVDLNKIVGHASDDFERLIEEKKATVVKDNLPVIQADKRMMVQLFENLISNALKYSAKDKPPRIIIKGTETEDEIKVSFQDNGIGFDEKYLPQMFTLFQRLHDRSAFEGTGLGLAICKKIVDFHGGTIWASATEGEGATFYITLPKINGSNFLNEDSQNTFG
jgi:light-regulated signal transduction histidine kinase (bacteriophytochrome)